jgi:hypothetical protein
MSCAQTLEKALAVLAETCRLGKPAIDLAVAWVSTSPHKGDDGRFVQEALRVPDDQDARKEPVGHG